MRFRGLHSGGRVRVLVNGNRGKHLLSLALVSLATVVAVHVNATLEVQVHPDASRGDDVILFRVAEATLLVPPTVLPTALCASSHPKRNCASSRQR